jgi:predicted DNA-binding transcriptional regulator AlpA
MPDDKQQFQLPFSGARTRKRSSAVPEHKALERVVPHRIAGIDQLLGTHDIERITGRHRCTIYRWVRSGAFPEKRAGGGRGWLKSDVERWLKGDGLSEGP